MDFYNNLTLKYTGMSNQEIQDHMSVLRNRDAMWARIRVDYGTADRILQLLAVEYFNKQRVRIIKDLHAKYSSLIQYTQWQQLLANSVEVKHGTKGE